MNKVKILTHQEDAVFERLAEPENPRGFFIEVVDMLEDAVDQLMRRAFRQEEYAVKYAIEPLLNGKGPLADLHIRLKLIFALGLISYEVSQDIERFIRLRDFLVADIHDHRFGESCVTEQLNRLHSLQNISMMQIDEPSDSTDAMLYQLQLNRRDQVIRSALLLAVSSVLSELNKDSPI
ncbi:MltR family transcriptional regulator [Tolumonas lignilytica]|jgi:Transcriptional regulator|uniref:MltR family transcriptional regulator n=1 Tax=Tolumonas lignilytica TaxID=1283284 RepID=UPI0004ACE389|nr:MltR family transcriptional regulator [Tolumonas lignilytica]